MNFMKLRWKVDNSGNLFSEVEKQIGVKKASACYAEAFFVEFLKIVPICKKFVLIG